MRPEDRVLDRRLPTDFVHVERYPLTAVTIPVSVPGVGGFNWYSLFDQPVKDRKGFWRIPGDVPFGSLRGGHAVAFEPVQQKDTWLWWVRYDQGSEGACVGFGASRMMSILNRRRYDARWLYLEAQKVDEWPGEAYSGTSVRAALDVLRSVGHKRVHGFRLWEPELDQGIAANRWATTVDDVLASLGTPHLDYVTLLNSWGRGYPHRVRVPANVLAQLLSEDGEYGVVTDR